MNAIGICLIHAYANPVHEHRVAEILAEEYPAATLSLSSLVLPEYREYERAVTTLVDAFVKPHMTRYLEHVHAELGPTLGRKPFLVMQSSGGVASTEQVMRKPITTALSGPAAGILGSDRTSTLSIGLGSGISAYLIPLLLEGIGSERGRTRLEDVCHRPLGFRYETGYHAPRKTVSLPSRLA